MKLRILTPSQHGIGNMNIVRQTGGYAREISTDLSLSDETFLFYLKYRAKLQGDPDYFLYDIKDKFMWEFIGIQQKTFINKMDNLVKAGYLIRELGRRSKIKYKFKVLDYQSLVKIPMGILLLKGLDWEQKTALVKIYRECLDGLSATDNLVQLISKNETEKITGLTYKRLSTLVPILHSNNLVNYVNGEYILNFSTLLTEVNEKTIEQLGGDLIELRSEIDKLKAENKKLLNKLKQEKIKKSL
jgi:hypothetical protein